MSHIVVLGAGVMASALCVPAADNQATSLTLVGSPLDDAIITALKDAQPHPTLQTHIPACVTPIYSRDVTQGLLRRAQIIVIGVSSPGVNWACDVLTGAAVKPPLLALVTKGLVQASDHAAPPLTYADALAEDLTDPTGNLVGIGGPCIARELAMRLPTSVMFASRNQQAVKTLKDALQTQYYRITTSEDIVGLEACAALKNFLCIGISAMITRYQMGSSDAETSSAKNPVAALFNQAVYEMDLLSRWIGQTEIKNRNRQSAAYGLAGLGDLHVTVGGGRNSRLGLCVGQGKTVKEAIANELRGITVEGVDTGKNLYSGLTAACQSGLLNASQIPLTLALMQAIIHDHPFEFDFNHLPPGSDHET